MNCFMFPGQPLFRGAQLPVDSDFLELAEMARVKTSLDLESFNWIEGTGNENIKLQVYGVVMSLYHLRLLHRRGVKPGLVAEHSMGIYAALAACGSLPEEDAIELVFRVGNCMAEMGATRSFSLGCIVGLSLEQLLAIAENNNVYLANLNTSRHFLLSGERCCIEQAAVDALNRGAFSVKTFPSDAPLHTPLLAEKHDALQSIFNDYRYRDPAIPLLNHIDQDFLAVGDIAEFMLIELTLPVYWEKSYRALRTAGATTFFEIGEGDALKKYNRWIDNESCR